MARRIDDIVAKLNKKYGGQDDAPVVFRASESPILKINRLRTGVFSIDLATGGGVPQGRVTRVFGPYSSGKTWLCLRIIRENQHLCHNCWETLSEKKGSKCCGSPQPFRTMWLDAEGVWDNDWAEAQGVNTANVFVVRTESSERSMDICHASLEELAFDLVVVDSVAALTSIKEIESSQEDAKVALNARVMNEAMRKWVSCLNGVTDLRSASRRTTIILINQIRMTISAFGDPEVQTGGKAPEFASSLDIRPERNRTLTDTGKLVGFNVNTENAGVPVAILCRFRIPKNKVAPPHRAGEFLFWFKDDPKSDRKVGDVDCSQAIFDHGQRLGSIVKRGRMYVAFIAGDEVELSTRAEDAVKAILKDSSLSRRLEDDIIERLVGGGPSPSVGGSDPSLGPNPSD